MVLIYKITRRLHSCYIRFKLASIKRIYRDRLSLPSRFSVGNDFKISYDRSKSRISIDEGSFFRDYCRIVSEKNSTISIGKNVFFNNFCSLNALGEITIGNNCSFGEGVKMYDHNHTFSNMKVLIQEQGYTVGKITIGDNCWVGSNVIILKDVTIGSNSVIGAGCIIYKSVPANSVIVNHQNLMNIP